MPRKKTAPLPGAVIVTMPDTQVEGEAQILGLIVERYRRRVSWHKAEKSLTLQGRAICRRLCDGDKDEANELFDRVAAYNVEQVQGVLAGFVGNIDDKAVQAIQEVFPILMARLTIEVARAEVERELEKLAKRLPIAAWVETVDGMSYGSLAAIIGSVGEPELGAAGNLHTYDRVQKLWKRMGLAVMSNGRQRQQKDPALALEHGYSPGRRSVMWNIGTSILRTQTERVDKETGQVDAKGKVIRETCEVKKEAGPWRRLYDKRKEYESAKNEAGEYADQAAKRLQEATFGKETSAYKAYSAGKLPPLHLHARAQRYMEKQLLKELWTQWRAVMEKPILAAPVQAERELEAVAA